jgi:hypothetical protein
VRGTGPGGAVRIRDVLASAAHPAAAPGALGSISDWAAYLTERSAAGAQVPNP